MVSMKRIAWVLVGVLIGGVASSSVAAVKVSQDRPASRLITIPTLPPTKDVYAYFIKDTKTGACWLTIRSRDDMSGALSPAPAASCEP
jgi:hypothetical protein